MGAYGKAMGVMSYGKDTYFVKIHTNPIYGKWYGGKSPIPIPYALLWKNYGIFIMEKLLD